MQSDGAAFLALLKLPALLAEAGIAWVLFRCARGRWGRPGAAAVALLYLLSPAVLVNGAAWGQVDAVLTLAIIGSLLSLARRRYGWAGALFAVALWSSRRRCCGCQWVVWYWWSIAGADVPHDPLWPPRADSCSHFRCWCCPSRWFRGQAGSSSSTSAPSARTPMPRSTPSISMRCWVGTGRRSTASPLTATPWAWGLLFVLPTLVFAGLLLSRSRRRDVVFYLAALMAAMAFTFLPKMHERYLYAVIPLLLLCFGRSRDRRFLLLAIGYSVTVYIGEVATLAARLGVRVLRHSEHLPVDASHRACKHRPVCVAGQGRRGLALAPGSGDRSSRLIALRRHPLRCPTCRRCRRNSHRAGAASTCYCWPSW